MNYQTVRDARIDLGLTQAEMAAKLGISRPTYAKWEETPGIMTVDAARRVCRILGKQFSDIFFGNMMNDDSLDVTDDSLAEVSR